MPAVRDAAKERQPGTAPLLVAMVVGVPAVLQPLPLIAYVTGVLACYLAFTGWEATHTPVTAATSPCSAR